MFSPQDLAAWRETGHHDWLAHQQVIELAGLLAAEVAQLKPEADAPQTNTIANFVAAQYALAAYSAVCQAGGASLALPTLSELSGKVAALRLGDHNAERLQLLRERLQLLKDDSFMRYKKRIWVGLDTLRKYVTSRHPRAQAAFEALVAQMNEPLDDPKPKKEL
jgi:hypothetical protein